MCTCDDDDCVDLRSEILALLDDRHRLREDPDRRSELRSTYELLRERLRQIDLDDKS